MILWLFKIVVERKLAIIIGQEIKIMNINHGNNCISAWHIDASTSF